MTSTASKNLWGRQEARKDMFAGYMERYESRMHRYVYYISIWKINAVPINLNVTTNVHWMNYHHPCQKGIDIRISKSPFTDNRKSIGCLMLPLTSCTQIKTQIWVFPKIGEPQNAWFIFLQALLKRMIWGENPPFLETSFCSNEDGRQPPAMESQLPKLCRVHGARIQDFVFIGISRARVMEKAERNFQLSSALSRFNPWFFCTICVSWWVGCMSF